MMVRPFRGLRPRPDLAHRIPSVPYDVVDTEEARRLAEGDPHTFLHVVRPEIDLDPSVPADDDRVYARGAESFRAMIERGWLVRDERPSYYVYRLTVADRSQTGILGAAAVPDYREGRVKRHELTRPDKVQDRVRLSDALSAHPGPVFLTYRGLPELNAIVSGVVARAPDVGFDAPDAVRHELWVVNDPATCSKIEKLFRAVRATYVADGHHRAEAAAQVAALRAERGETGPDAASRWFLAAHFPSNQIRVLDYNRVVTDLNGLDASAFLERVRAAGFYVKGNHRGRRPPSPETFGVYLGGRWFLLTPRHGIVPEGDPVRRLDVSILNECLLQPILGIGDPRTDRRLDFVGGSRGMDELERRVDSGSAAVAFSLYPTRLEDVMAVADAGRVMPPKSTWFEPKLRSGMVVQSIEGDL